MALYPNGTPSTGVFSIFQSDFSPDNVVRGIRDNYSPVNRTTLLNSLGYQVGLVQNFVNATYLGREDTPVQNAYINSGWAEGAFVSWSGEALSTNEYYRTYVYPDMLETNYISINALNIEYARLAPDYLRLYQINIPQGSNSTALLDKYGLNISTKLGATYDKRTAGYNISGVYNSSTLNLSGTDIVFLAPISGSSSYLFTPATNATYAIGRGTSQWSSIYTNCVIGGPTTINTTPGFPPNYSYYWSAGVNSNWTENSHYPGFYIYKTSTTGATTTSLFSHLNGNKLRLSLHSVGGAGPEIHEDGYLYVNSNGQLEFYKTTGTGAGSGYVLTNFT